MAALPAFHRWLSSSPIVRYLELRSLDVSPFLSVLVQDSNDLVALFK